MSAFVERAKKLSQIETTSDFPMNSIRKADICQQAGIQRGTEPGMRFPLNAHQFLTTLEGMEMTKSHKSKRAQKKYPERAKDVPVTQAMLFEVRDGLHARMDGFDSKIGGVDAKIGELGARMDGFNARMDGFDARMDAFDARMDGLDARMDGLDAKVDRLDSKIDGIGAKVDQRFHEIKLLVEEQNARNRIVLDGLTSLFARQERIEKKFG